MTPRPWPLCLLALSIAVWTPAVASAQVRPGSDASHARLQQMATELRAITLRMGQVADQLTKLGTYEANQSGLVSQLKRRPAGMMRDAQLQNALKELRAALAMRRGLIQRQRILATTRETRKVALSRLSREEAALLMVQAQALMGRNRGNEAREQFAYAFDYLTMAGPTTRKTAVPTHPSALKEVPTPLIASGDETPDDLRDMAQILRDGGEKAKWTANALQRDLEQLQRERTTLSALLNQVPFHPPTGAALQAALDDHIAQLGAHIDYLRTHFSRSIRQATSLERRADREEQALLAHKAAP